MQKKQVITSNSRSFKEKSLDETRGWIIDRLNYVELQVNMVLIDYFKPKHSEQFLKIMLHSSIIGIGEKAKILMGTNLIDKKVFENILKLGRIRNGFAHAPIDERLFLDVDEESRPIYLDSKPFLDVMNSNGKVDSKMAEEYYNQFHETYEELLQELIIPQQKKRSQQE